MTTATSTHQRGMAESQPAIPMARLVSVELRKMVDTRAGRWLLISTGGLIALVLGVFLAVADPEDRTFALLFAVAQYPLSILLPVIGVLAATSEWSQRTILGTFSLVPSRLRSLTSKVLASLVLASAATLVTLLLAAVGAVIAPLFGEVQGDWSLALGDAAQIVLYQWLSMLLGVALGTLLLSSGLAIVLYFALPTIWGGITQAFHSLHDAQLWLDTGTTWARLLDNESAMNGDWWARVAATTALWVVLPLAVGAGRVLRKEVD